MNIKPQVGQIWHTKKPFKWPQLITPPGKAQPRFETWYEIIQYFETDFEWMRRQKRFFVCNQFTHHINEDNRFIFIHYHSEGFFKGKNLELVGEADKVAKMLMSFGGVERAVTESTFLLLTEIVRESKNARLKKLTKPLRSFEVGTYG